MGKAAANHAVLGFERVAAVCAALLILALVVFLLIRNDAIADSRLFFALRLVLSFAAAVLGATIPGFLTFGWSGAGLTVRAGGALALFAVTFFYTPDLLVQNGSYVGGNVTNSTINVSPSR